MSKLSEALNNRRLKEPSTWLGMGMVIAGINEIAVGIGSKVPEAVGQAGEVVNQVGEAVAIGMTPAQAIVMAIFGLFMTQADTTPEK